MNRPAMPQETNRFMRLFALLLTPLLLAACDAPKQADASAEPPLAGALIGGDFALTGEDGKTVEWKEFAGQWRIVYFGYTFCPDVCPVDAVAIGQGLRQFEKDSPEQGKNVTPIFITVDPERDTPEVLAEFTDSFHPRMIGLTGSVDDIAATAKKFVVWFEKGEPTENGGYLVNHTNQTVLFDPQGNPVALLPTDKGGKAVAQDLAKWVK